MPIQYHSIIVKNRYEIVYIKRNFQKIKGGLIMKKLFFLLLLSVVLTFVGCSSNKELPSDSEMKQLIYDYVIAELSVTYPEYSFAEYIEDSSHSTVELTEGYVYPSSEYGEIYVRGASVKGSADSIEASSGKTLRRYYDVQVFAYFDNDCSTEEAQKYNHKKIDDFISVISYKFTEDYYVLNDGSEIPIAKYTPTKNGTGLEFSLPNLAWLSTEETSNPEISYVANRLLYGIGTYTGYYDPQKFFSQPQISSYNVEDIHGETGNLMGKMVDIYYNITTKSEEVWTLTASTEYTCDDNGNFGSHPFGVSCELETPSLPYCYITYDGIEFFERISGNEVSEGYYNIDTGQKTVINNGNYTANNTHWPNSANYSWQNIANAGIGIACDNDDNWYCYGGSDSAIWIASEKEWISEITILFDQYLVKSKDGINYSLYDWVNGQYVRQLGFSYHMTPNGFESGHIK